MTTPPFLPDAPALFATRPWREVTPEALGAAEAVPTMLSPEECRFYFWLTSVWASGDGATVDLGSFVGGSTARLAAGHAAAGHEASIHAYDRFTADETAKARHLYPTGIPAFPEPGTLLLAHRLLTPWKPNVCLHEGDILDQQWPGDPIEVLVVDAAKTAMLADHIAASFYPALIPGRSILVHQDFLHRIQPWLPVQMQLLAGCFTPLARVARDCMVFLCTASPTPEAIAAAHTADLSDAEMARLIRAAARRYAPLVGRYAFARMVRKLTANPGARSTWKMWRD